jgi:hypothetical protein
MSRLGLQVFYLWRHVLSAAPPCILWWSNLEILFDPPPPLLSLHRRAALSSISNGTQSVYSRKNPKSSLYCELAVLNPCSLCSVKWTLSRDFRPSVFFAIKQCPPALNEVMNPFRVLLGYSIKYDFLSTNDTVKICWKKSQFYYYSTLANWNGPQYGVNQTVLPIAW